MQREMEGNRRGRNNSRSKELMRIKEGVSRGREREGAGEGGEGEGEGEGGAITFMANTIDRYIDILYDMI